MSSLVILAASVFDIDVKNVFLRFLYFGQVYYVLTFYIFKKTLAK